MWLVCDLCTCDWLGLFVLCLRLVGFVFVLWMLIMLVFGVCWFCLFDMVVYCGGSDWLMVSLFGWVLVFGI